MKAKTKAFDCVKMKHNAQRKLRAEYEARQGEFSSYFAFLDAKGNESKWQPEFWARVRAARTASKT